MSREKQLTIALLTEKLQKLTGKKVMLEFYSRDYVKEKYGEIESKEIEANIEDEAADNENIWDYYVSLETPEEVDKFVEGFRN